MISLALVNWSLNKDKYKPHIHDISQLCQQPNLYQLIDNACSHKQAFLFVGDEGFIVLRPRYWQGEIYVEVMATYSEGRNNIVRYQPFIIELATKGHAQFIEFRTARKGFERLAPKLGWAKCGYHHQLAIWRLYL